MYKCPSCDGELSAHKKNDVYAFKNRNALLCSGCNARYRLTKPVSHFVVYLHFTVMTFALLGLVHAMLGAQDKYSVYFAVIFIASVILYFKYTNPAPKAEQLERVD